MKINFYRILLLSAIIITASVGFTAADPAQAEAASVTADKELAQTYLNIVSKYLYLGVTGQNKVELKVKNDVLPEGAIYRWGINKEKGDPYAVALNNETGLVKAKSAGTAYVQCIITLPDNTVISPEAKVTVINNITGIEISNIPEDRILTIDTVMDFNEKILNTTAGSDKVSSGIVRWEIGADTAGVGSATQDGIVIPQKEGEFSIRAVCFENILNYNSWIADKEVNAGHITAASEWVTLTVVPYEGEAKTQEQLNTLLVKNKITRIIIPEDAILELTIPEGDYSDKILVIDKTNAEITNNGVFKRIIIQAAYKLTWNENASDNSFEVYNSYLDFKVSEKSKVKNIDFTNSSEAAEKYEKYDKDPVLNHAADLDYIPVNTVFIRSDGIINAIDISVVSNINLKGSGSIDRLTIKEAATGTKAAVSSIKDLDINANCIVSVFEGKERTILHLQGEVSGRIENLSSSILEVYTTHDGFHGYFYIPDGYAQRFELGGSSFLFEKIATSNVIKFTPVYNVPVTTTKIEKGNVLFFSEMTGSFYYNSMKVDGLLKWKTPYYEVKESGYYEWIFMPYDLKHYNMITGSAWVDVIEK